MKNSLSRREFLRNAALAGAAAAIVPNDILASVSSQNAAVRVVAVKGADYYKNAIAAVDMLGGIGKFVKIGDRVVILANSPWNNPGSYTNSDITLAVLKMCLAAGAKEVITLNMISPEYWKRGVQGANHILEISSLKSSSSKIMKEIPLAKVLKNGEFSAELFDSDVYINIPIAKDHKGTRFSGNLKNLMGACPGTTNRRLHMPEGKTGDFYAFGEHLSQCIADINLVRMPNLSVCDVTEAITTNGPAGPGEIVKPQTVLAGTDALAVDVVGASLIGLNPKEILLFGFAAEHKLGENRMEFIKVDKKEL
jgi:uncharacterized protein (DUF362 family)